MCIVKNSIYQVGLSLLKLYDYHMRINFNFLGDDEEKLWFMLHLASHRLSYFLVIITVPFSLCLCIRVSPKEIMLNIFKRDVHTLITIENLCKM